MTMDPVSTQHAFGRVIAEGINVGASDWHFTPGQRVAIRVHGEMRLTDTAWTDKQSENAVAMDFWQADFAGAEAKRELIALSRPERRTADFEILMNGARFRTHCKMLRGAIGFSLRRIGMRIPDLDELGTPQAFRTMLNRRRGLLLVTGETGSGKSTTLAASLAEVVKRSAVKICTYEHPIEYELPQGIGVVQQHAVGADIPSYHAALESAMREDPDIMMFGELRDPATMLAALEAANTGHLVVGTLHTGTAPHTVSRLLNAPADGAKGFYRGMIAQTLLGVLCQKLLPASKGGRVAAYEVMVVNPAIRAQIAEDRTHLIKSSMTQAMGEGMVTFGRHLAELVHQGLISEGTAIEVIEDDETDFRQQISNLRKGIGARAVIPPPRHI